MNKTRKTHNVVRCVALVASGAMGIAHAGAITLAKDVAIDQIAAPPPHANSPNTMPSVAGTSSANQAPSAALATPTGPTGSLSTKSTYGELLDNPVSRSVLEKLIPEVVNNPQSQMARGLALAALAQYEPSLTAEKLKQIDEALAAAVTK